MLKFVAFLSSFSIFVSAELELNYTTFGEEIVEYSDPDGTLLEGYLVVPKKASSRNKVPAVILFHAFTGRTEFDDNKAQEIAKMGYVAFAADTYGRDWVNLGLNESFGMMADLLENRTTTLKGRILAALNVVNNLTFVDKTRVGSIGFCYGGLCSLDLARYDVGVRAVVAFHADLRNLPGNSNETTRTAIQAHHGDADLFTTNEQADDFLEEMRQREADWQFNRYGGAQHAFTLPGVDDFGLSGAAYNPVATRRAWSAMESFLKEKL